MSALLDLITTPFAYLLAFFNSFTKSYIVAIFLFAIVMKLILLPFAIKQQKTQIKGAKLRPKMAAIEKKYAGRTDQKTLQKKQQEIMDLQRDEGYSPLSGCLPMLIQFPIIIILYNIIQNPLHHILGWEDSFVNANIIHKIAAIDPAATKNQIKTLTFLLERGAEAGFGEDILGPISKIDLGIFGSSNAALGHAPTEQLWPYILIPILAALFSYGSMWITRKLTAGSLPQQQQEGPESKISKIIMDLMMPVMSFVLAIQYPAMLGIYWIFQSVLGVVQQFILSKAMPLPTYTEEEIRAIMKAEKERANANRAAMREAQASARSLHHIDDDDEDADVVVPQIRSKFDEDDDLPATSAPEENAPKDESQSSQKKHLRQAKKKK